jgi:hypothetical protein
MWSGKKTAAESWIKKDSKRERREGSGGNAAVLGIKCSAQRGIVFYYGGGGALFLIPLTNITCFSTL